MSGHFGAQRGVVIALISCFALLLGACAPATPEPAPTPASASQPAAPQPAAVPTSASQPVASQPAAPGSAPSGLEGRWEGPVAVAGQNIGMVVKISGSGSDLKGLLDIPAQGQRDLPLKNITYQAPKVHFEAFDGARTATFDAELKDDGTMAGNFGQAGYKGTFTFKPGAAAPTPTAAPVPYKEEEVTFQNGDAKLAGTLTIPQGSGPFPAVVLISGSGSQNRDEEVFGFKPFRMIADSFTRQGIAVLRYDDRGVGGRTGDVEKATSEDFAGDVVAAVALLRARPEINPKGIGVLGHSEGGIIAPMVANRSQDVSFVIMLAGSAMPGREVLVQQAGDVARASGASQAQVEQTLAQQRKVVDAVITGEGLDQLKADLTRQTQAQFEAMPAEQQKALGADPATAAKSMVDAQIGAMRSPWFQFFLTYDPAPALAKVKVPVLALFGGKDVQVAAGPNEAAAKAALAQGGNTRGITRIYPDANHLFQPAKTGGLEEYTQLKDMVPGLLDDTAKWIKDVTKG